MALSSCAEDGHQMYSGGSVVGKASLIDPEISSIPLLICTAGQKLRNLASFMSSLSFELPTLENAARYLNSETNLFSSDDRSMSLPSLVKLGPRNPENRPEKVPQSLKLHGKNVLNCQ